MRGKPLGIPPLIIGFLCLAVIPAVPRVQAGGIEAASYVDNHLAGKVPAAARPMYSAGDFNIGKGFVRNVNLWCADLDLTCFSPWNSTEHNLQGGTLITRRHVLLAHHFSNPSTGTPPMIPGITTIEFVAKDNTLYTRKITKLTRVENTDLLIGTLDSDLPAKINPVQILPADKVKAISPGTPLIYSGQDKWANVGECVGSSGPMFAVRTAVPEARNAWSTGGPARIGDSGSPIFLPINGRVALICHFFFANGGPITGNYIVSINAITGPGYPVTEATLGN